MSFEPRYREAVRVADGVVRIVAHNPGPFTGTGTNTYLLGERRVMVVDPGPDDPAHVEAILAAVAGRPVSHILVSHTHRDHVDALRPLVEATGAPTVGEGAHRDARPLKPGEMNPFLSAADTLFRPDIVLRDGEVLDNGEVAVMAIATPGHTANHLAFGVGDVCLSGDHVMGWSTTVIAPPDGGMADYLHSLDRLLAEPHRVYFPGHGDRILDPHRAVSAMRTHRLMRESAVLARIHEGDRSTGDVVAALYVGIDPRLYGAAGLSVLAHLEKLEAEARVVSNGFGTKAVWSPA